MAMTPPAAARQAVSAVLAGLLAGVLGALLLAVGVRWTGASSLSGPIGEGGWTGRTRGWFTTRGFYPPETDGNTGAHYSWTGESVRLAFPHLSRRQAYDLSFEISANRPPDVAPPSVEVLTDGAPAGTFPTSNDRGTVTVTLPPQASDRAVVALRVSQAIAPHPGDERTLGVIVRSLSLKPARGHALPARAVLVNIALASALVVMGVWLCGAGGRVSAAVTVVIPAVFAWLSLQDAAFIGTYTDALRNVGIGIALLGALVAVARAWRPSIAGLPDWSMAVGLIAAVSVVKLAVFTHPQATVGDGIFQLHRALMVRAGSYFFTSITPRPFFEFPYAIGLYVTAQPFWSYFSTDLDQVRLLRGLSLGADALVGLACYAATYRQWRDRGTALLVAGLWPFARAPLEALCNSNLTNVFAQGLFGVGLAAMAWIAAGAASIAALVVSLAFVTAGFLSHFGTFTVGVPLIGAIGVLTMAAGRGQVRRAGLWMLAIAALGLTLAYVVYYSHFTEVYRATWARIAAHETTDTTVGSAIAASPATKFQRWITDTSDDYGLPGVVLAVAALIGAARLFATRRREGVTLVLLGWLAVWTGFSVLGIVSPIQMRVNLAAAPAFVCLGAFGLTAVSRHSATGRAIAVFAAVAIAFSGARLWLMCIGR
jgi:hypothetical protein